MAKVGARVRPAGVAATRRVGGTLVFQMGPTPNRAWASDPAAAPPSMEPAPGAP